jgi:murein L,D-transpeptidase YafK
MPRKLVCHTVVFILCADLALAADQQQAAQIVVYKAERKMDLLDRDASLLRSYRITLGANPTGHKLQEGDEKTPEGKHNVSGRNPRSRYHLSLRISYPNEQDTDQAIRRGVHPGGDIMIHGLRNGLGWIGRWHRLFDWTDGCIAVTNDEMDEIWSMVQDGTPIEIRR